MNTNIQNPKKILLLQKLATMYYIRGMTQKEIADEISLSRSSIARLLIEARENNIVQFHINSNIDTLRLIPLEEAIKTKYSILDCVTISQNCKTTNIIPTYLENLIPHKGILGIGGGKTLLQLANQMWNITPRKNLRIVQLTGSLGNIPDSFVTKVWADALETDAVYNVGPLLIENEEEKSILENSPTFTDVKKCLNNINVSISSVGTNQTINKIESYNFARNFNFEKFKSEYIGDIGFHFFDQDGVFSANEISSHVFGISPSEYLKIPLKIIIAYGVEKIEPIKAALKGGLMDILITNEQLASQLI